jgi:hypothetical protein
MSNSNIGNHLATMDWNIMLYRLMPYWLTIVMSLWILAFLYVYTNEDATNLYVNGLTNPVGIFYYLNAE